MQQLCYNNLGEKRSIFSITIINFKNCCGELILLVLHVDHTVTSLCCQRRVTSSGTITRALSSSLIWFSSPNQVWSRHFTGTGVPFVQVWYLGTLRLSKGSENSRVKLCQVNCRKPVPFYPPCPETPFSFFMLFPFPFTHTISGFAKFTNLPRLGRVYERNFF